MIARVVASGAMFCDNNSSRVSHLGRKPVSGGSPPSDSRVIIVSAVSIGDVVHVVIKSLVVFIEVVINDSINGVEMVM